MDEYVALTKRSVTPVKTADISKDKCFYNNYDLVSDHWGGAYGSQLVYEKNKGIDGRSRRGKLLGYWRRIVFIPKTNTDQIPKGVNDHTHDLYHKEWIKQRNNNLNELRKTALSYFKRGSYEMAQVMFTIIELKYRDKIYRSNLSIINDLALSLYKQNKYDASESWSEKVLKFRNADNYKRHAAAANYNLGLVSEAKNNTDKALNHYKQSYELRHTAAAKKAVERLE